jgi:hypothetical protein
MPCPHSSILVLKLRTYASPSKVMPRPIPGSCPQRDNRKPASFLFSGVPTSGAITAASFRCKLVALPEEYNEMQKGRIGLKPPFGSCYDGEQANLPVPVSYEGGIAFTKL